MNTKILFIALLVSSVWSFPFSYSPESTGGGVECAACSIVVGLFEQWTEYNEKTFGLPSHFH